MSVSVQLGVRMHWKAHLIIKVGVDLRRRLVEDDNVTAAEDGPRHCDQLALPCAQGACLAYGHVQRDLVSAFRALQRPLKDRSEVTSFEDVPAFLISVLIEWVQIAS